MDLLPRVQVGRWFNTLMDERDGKGLRIEFEWFGINLFFGLSWPERR